MASFCNILSGNYSVPEKTKTDLPPAALPGAKLLKKFEQNFCLKKQKAPYYSAQIN